MSLRFQESSAEALPAGEAVEPLVAPAVRAIAPRISRRTAMRLAAAGRFGVVWLPVYALVSAHEPSLLRTTFASLLVATAYALAMRGAFVAGRSTMLALGAAVAAGVGSATGFIVAAGLNGFVPGLHVSQVTLLEMTGAVFLLAAAWESVVGRSAAAEQRILIVGATEGGAELVEDLALASTPFDLLAIVDDDRESEQLAGIPVARVADLPELVDRQRPDIVVLAVGHDRPQAFDSLLDVAGAGFKVVGLPEFYEHAFGRVPVRTVTPSWFMSVLHLYNRPYTRFAKRAFDISVAAFGLLLTAPLLPLLALLVTRTPGPAIFRQTRLGEGGRLFTIFKFRTMRQDAEAGGAVWASERDPRITSLGRIMRKTRLDELPQLWNVLRGDMSIVGPRPERPEFMDELREAVPFWSRRHLVKPGITGWAQVRMGYTADADGTAEKLSFDLWYLRHRSLVVDIAICIKTFSTLVSGSGAR